MTVIPGPPYPGVYLHYKGDPYVVHKIIFDSSNSRNGKIIVFYESLAHGSLTVRDAQEFRQLVHEDGRTSLEVHGFGVVCGNCVPRFRMLTPDEIEEYNRPKESWKP